MNPTYSDEIKSIQLLMAMAFPDLEIRTERPASDDEEYDMLIEDTAETVSSMRGTYMHETRMPIIVQVWTTTRMEARDYIEQIAQSIRMPVVSYRNAKMAVPVWSFAAGEPDIEGDDPIEFLKVKDITTRVLDAETPGNYVAMVELIFTGWRVTDHTIGQPIITHVGPIHQDAE